jgi:hypothetical protein
VQAGDDTEPLAPWRGLQNAALAKAHEAAGFAEDQVGEDLDAEKLTAGHEPARQAEVFGRWLGIPARVVVSEDKGRASGKDSGLEHFPRVNERAREPADERVWKPRTRCRTVSMATTNTSRSVSPMYWARSGAASAARRICGRSASFMPGSRTKAMRKPGMP